MKKALYIIIGLAVCVIFYKKVFDNNADERSYDQETTTEPKIHTGDEPFKIGDGSLEGSWLRFDGVYQSEMDQMTYYMRFYPEGNVTLIGGNETGMATSLKNMMAQDSPPGINNIHNTMVELKGDSLIFSTKAMKGLIDYKGVRVSGDNNTLRFLKHSRINGRKAILDYAFVAD